MATKLCSFTLDEDAIHELDELVKMVSRNKSQILRELIRKEYIMRLEMRNA